MNQKPKYAKIKIIKPQADGTTLIRSESYREELHSYREEVEQSKLTDYNSLINDVMASLKIIKERNTPILTIEIHMDRYGQPERINQKYITEQETYGRK